MRHLALTAVFLFALPLLVRADEESVPLDKVPKPVLDAVKKRFPKAQVVSVTKETEDGRTVYELELKQGTKEIDVTVTAEGAITQIEQEIDAKDLPRAVLSTLQKKYPKATYLNIDAVYVVKDGKETLDYYEVLLLTTGKKEITVQLLANGKIKEEEGTKPEKKE